MNGHPLALVIALADLISLMVCASVALRLFSVLDAWQPASGDRKQLERERDLQLSTHQGRWLFALQSAAGLIFVLAVSSVWPRYVPGAMCGTGVLQAMGPAGLHALIYRVLVILLLYSWRVLQHLDASDPHAPMSEFNGRVLLLCTPLLFMSAFAGYQAFAAIDGQVPVSCCAVVYDRVRSTIGMVPLSAHWPVVWMAGCLFGAAPVALWAVMIGKRPLDFPTGAYVGMGALTAVWVVVAVVALKQGFSAYIYQVLQHHCPWCLFLPEHGCVGFALFGMLAVVSAEGLAAVLCRSAARRHPGLVDAARQRLRLAGLRLLAATLGFVLLAGGPAVVWRIRFGVWLH
jgi:hypothetical protein